MKSSQNFWGDWMKLYCWGTGAVEIKKRIWSEHGQWIENAPCDPGIKKYFALEIKATFLRAHAVPAEFRIIKPVTSIIWSTIWFRMPRIAEEGLADYCDVFWDKIISQRGKYPHSDAGKKIRYASESSCRATESQRWNWSRCCMRSCKCWSSEFGWRQWPEFIEQNQPLFLFCFPEHSCF